MRKGWILQNNFYINISDHRSHFLWITFPSLSIDKKVYYPGSYKYKEGTINIFSIKDQAIIKNFKKFLRIKSLKMKRIHEALEEGITRGDCKNCPRRNKSICEVTEELLGSGDEYCELTKEIRE